MRGLSGFTMIAATACSTIMHFFILTLVDTVPLVPKEIAARPAIITVDLMSLGMESAVPHEDKGEAKAVVQKEEKEVKKKEEKKKEAKKEEKQEVIKDKVLLADRSKERKEKKEEPKAGDEQRRLAAIKEIERKVAGRSTEPPPAGTDAEKNIYAAIVEERVKGVWVIPDSLAARGLKAVVIFEIGKKGEVINLRFKQSSGSLPYDQSVMRAITKAAPFPPPQQVLLGEEFELTIQP